ncbi:MAG: sporulation transcriptional regulator SpoIIID [Bacillota bacterium]
MKDYIRERVLQVGRHILTEGATVRDAADWFGISKSTAHKDVAERLLEVNPHLAGNVEAVLRRNKAERHLRGGEATRKKYLRKENV